MEQRHGLVLVISIIVVTLVIAIGISLTPPPRIMTVRELAIAVANAPKSCRARLRATVRRMKRGMYDYQYRRIYERDCPPLIGYGVSRGGGFVVVQIPREQ